MVSVRTLLNRHHRSGQVAKGRLEHVLAHDRARISPGKLQHVGQEIARVVAQHLDAEPEEVEIQLTRRGRKIQLEAHVPLRPSAV